MASRFTSAALTPFNSIPGMVGGVISGVGARAGGALRKLGPLGRILAPIAELSGGVAGPIAGAVTATALGFGKQFIQGAVSSRSGFEEATRFLSRGPRGRAVEGIGSLGAGVRHGYDAMETTSHRLAVMRAIGGGRYTGTERLTGDTAIESPFQSLSNRMRQPIGSLIDFAGVARSGGMGMARTNEILQKIHKDITENRGIGRDSPEYMFQSQEQIRMTRQFLANQVGLTGRANPMQAYGALGMMNRLSTRFSPPQAAAATLMLQQGTLSPGGGDAGDLFMMRALGFANPMLEKYKKTAEEMGIDPNLFRRRNMFEYLRARDNPLTRIHAAMVGVRTEFGNRPDMQGYMLNTLIPQLGFTRAENIMKSFQEGGMGMDAKSISRFLQATVPGVGATAATESAAGETSTGLRNVKLLKNYHNFLMEVGGSQELYNLHSFLRSIQMITGKVIQEGIHQTGPVGQSIVEQAAALAGLSSTGMTQSLISAIEKVIDDMENKYSGSDWYRALKNIIDILMNRN